MAKELPKPLWRRNRIGKAGKGSQTPGIKKGDHCQTNPRKKFFACSTKAYKHPEHEGPVVIKGRRYEGGWHHYFKSLNLGNR